MKFLNKTNLYIQYLGARFFIFLIGFVPYNFASKIGFFFGLLASKLMRTRFKRSMKDIQKAFPQKSPEEVYAIARESWGNVGRTAAEFCKAYQMPKEKILKLINFIDSEEMIEYNQSGKGAILHLGHFANWEVFGLSAAIALKNMAAVVRPMSNPYVDKMVTKMRSALGTKIISAYNPLFGCLKALKNGHTIAILSDQSVPASKVYMNFMGRPSEFGPMTALLSLKAKVPIFPAQVFRKNGKITAKIYPAIYPKENYSHEAMVNLTKDLTVYYENWIKENPSDWLWAHNRWKREDDSRRALKRIAAGEGRQCED